MPVNINTKTYYSLYPEVLDRLKSKPEFADLTEKKLVAEAKQLGKTSIIRGVANWHALSIPFVNEEEITAIEQLLRRERPGQISYLPAEFLTIINLAKKLGFFTEPDNENAQLIHLANKEAVKNIYTALRSLATMGQIESIPNWYDLRTVLINANSLPVIVKYFETERAFGATRSKTTK